jgi:putative tryptophan/tyrosine transport system substrate-binding protein
MRSVWRCRNRSFSAPTTSSNNVKPLIELTTLGPGGRDMKRRDLVRLLCGAAMAWPATSRAQSRAMPVIGLLGLGSPDDPEVARNLAAFRAGLTETGFVEGKNVAIEYRWAHNHPQRLPALAADLVSRKVDVIVIEGGTPSALAAKGATAAIPIVFHSADAVADGLVSNLARPDANLTGVSLFGPEGLAKQYQLCSELIPRATTVGLLIIPKDLIGAYAVPEIEQAASAKGIELRIVDADSDGAIEAAYASLARLGAGVIVRAHVSLAEKLVAMAARHALPAVYNQRAFATAGGLLSYGPSIPAAYLIKGRYAGKLLRGAKPSDLPVQQATKLELIVNLRTAKGLGLAVPQTILARADEVLE